MKLISISRNTTSALAFIASILLSSCSSEDELSSIASISENESTENVTLIREEASNCRPGKSNHKSREVDIRNPVNDGTVDDRTCYADYFESREGSTTYGNYQIAVNSNHWDTNGLQPRIERSFPRSNSRSGSYVKFNGTFRILEVGKTTSDGKDGTYIAQAKGKHTGGGGSPDPAICLFLAKPVYGKDNQGRNTQVAFNIYREQINYRGGSGASGRRLVFLKRVGKGRATSFELQVGFKTVNRKKVHYANANIGGTTFNWNIPQPERGTQSGIRYGAYRVKGGKARIQWANTSFTRVNK